MVLNTLLGFVLVLGFGPIPSFGVAGAKGGPRERTARGLCGLGGRQLRTFWEESGTACMSHEKKAHWMNEEPTLDKDAKSPSKSSDDVAAQKAQAASGCQS
jgi:hypothetical protein